MRKTGLILLVVFSLTGCIISAGTLGGFPTITFPISKRKITIAIDTLFVRHPEYKIPNKWKDLDNWSASGYGFLDSRIFYFKTSPEEMYYVSFYGDGNEKTQTDTTSIAISIRAISKGNPKWLLESDLTEIEKKRISDRFYKDVILKLEDYTKSKVTIDN